MKGWKFVQTPFNRPYVTAIHRDPEYFALNGLTCSVLCSALCCCDLLLIPHTQLASMRTTGHCVEKAFVAESYCCSTLASNSVPLWNWNSYTHFTDNRGKAEGVYMKTVTPNCKIFYRYVSLSCKHRGVCIMLKCWQQCGAWHWHFRYSGTCSLALQA
jgi:hypothetical protein